MVVEFTSHEFEPRSWQGVLDTTVCDKVCQWLAAGPWFSLGTLWVSSTNKTDHQSIAEILLKVALNIITSLLPQIHTHVCTQFKLYVILTHLFLLTFPACIAIPYLGHTKHAAWSTILVNCPSTLVIHVYYLIVITGKEKLNLPEVLISFWVCGVRAFGLTWTECNLEKRHGGLKAFFNWFDEISCLAAYKMNIFSHCIKK